MTGRTNSGEYAPGIPHRVDLDQVEPLLRSLWEAAERAPGGDPTPLLKVRTLNLVVYVSGLEELARLRGPLAEINAAHPGRVMILCPDSAAPEDQISARATIYCFLARHGRQHVCGEEITLTAWGEALRQIHTAVLALRLSDLPVILWWTGEPPLEEQRFVALARTADRVILDSATYSRPLAQFQRQIAFLQQRRRDLALSDLNWTRLTPWRELVAQFYDDREALATLDRLREVTIEYAAPAPDGREPGLLQALLMLGWLSSRLNWQPVSGRKLDHGTALTLAAPNTSITATLRPVMGTATLDLNKVQLGSDIASFTVACDPDAGMAVEMRLPAREPVSSRRRLQKESIAGLMRQELVVAGHDAVFEATLFQAGRLAALVE